MFPALKPIRKIEHTYFTSGILCEAKEAQFSVHTIEMHGVLCCACTKSGEALQLN
jgi:hypothetical protein